MKEFEGVSGVPRFSAEEFAGKSSKYCILIPILNEHGRIEKELERAVLHGVDQLCAAVQDLANDRAKAKALATQARQFVAGLGWDSMAARYDPLLGIVGDRPES